jgi:hypothetical protein
MASFDDIMNHPTVSGMIAVKEKLQQAIEIAKSCMEPPLPTIVITPSCPADKNATILIDMIQSDTGHGRDIVVKKNGVIIVRESSDKFRSILLERLDGCKIFIMCKLVKVLFFRCTQTMVSVRQDLIGALEFFRCDNCNIDLRAKIPVTQIENCTDCKFVQRSDENVYAALICMNVTLCIAEPVSHTASHSSENKTYYIPLSDSRHYLLLSRKNGMMAVPEQNILNNIEQHLIMLSPDDLDNFSGDSMLSNFGTTPK